MNQDEILLSKEDGIVILTLNRPDKLNALTMEMIDRFPGIIGRNKNTQETYQTSGVRVFSSIAT